MYIPGVPLFSVKGMVTSLRLRSYEASRSISVTEKLPGVLIGCKFSGVVPISIMVCPPFHCWVPAHQFIYFQYIIN